MTGPGPISGYGQDMTSLVERLGASPDAKLLIIHVADLGLSQTTTEADYRTLRNGMATSASLVVPAPWARSSAADFRGDDVGVELTVVAELDRYRWGPITQAPSLLGGDGGFPRTITDLWDHADLDEMRRECRAQIERAILWGFDISHLGTRHDALLLRPEFFDIYLELAVDFSLPLRLLGAGAEPNVGFPVRRLAADEGVLFADTFHSVSGADPARQLVDLINSLPAGLADVTLWPAIDTPESRALFGDWADRASALADLLASEEVGQALRDQNVKLIGYRTLRAAMRDTRENTGAGAG